MRGFLLLAPLVVALSAASAAHAQLLPSEPVRALDGRLVVTGEATATIGREDHEAYFNYTDYERNALRTIRLSLGAVWQPTARVAFVGEVRSEDFDSAGAYAAYVRVRPFREHRLDVQAG